MFSVKIFRKPKEIKVFGEQRQKTKGKSWFSVKNVRKPKENRGFRWKTTENLMEIKVFDEKRQKT